MLKLLCGVYTYGLNTGNDLARALYLSEYKETVCVVASLKNRPACFTRSYSIYKPFIVSVHK